MKDVCRPSVVDVLGERHGQLLAALVERFATTPCSPFLRQQLETALALFEVALASGLGPRDAGLRLGAWLKIALKQSPELFVPESEAHYRLEALRGDWLEVLGDPQQRVTEAFERIGDVPIITAAIDAAAEILAPATSKSVRALFIGDCLVWDASLQLQIAARAHGIVVEPTILAQRIGADLRGKLVRRRGNEFDIVVYSPFSFEFSNEYAFACAPGAVLRAPRKSAKLLDVAMADVALTIETLAARFECPIYVHTVSGVQQSRPDWRSALEPDSKVHET